MSRILELGLVFAVEDMIYIGRATKEPDANVVTTRSPMVIQVKLAEERAGTPLVLVALRLKI